MRLSPLILVILAHWHSHIANIRVCARALTTLYPPLPSNRLVCKFLVGEDSIGDVPLFEGPLHSHKL